MGSITAGCIFSKTQQITPKLLTASSRSGSNSGRRLSAELEDQRTIPVPTMESNPAYFKTGEGAEMEKSGIGNTFMGEPILASNDPEGEAHHTLKILKIEQQVDISHMTVINNYRVANGSNSTTMQFLNQKIRVST